MWDFSTFYAFIAINSILSICFTVSKNFLLVVYLFLFILKYFLLSSNH